MTARPVSAGESGSAEGSTKPKWEGRSRGGRWGNGFFALISRSRVGRWVTPLFLFGVVLYFLTCAPKGRRVSFDLARRVGRGGTLWGRIAFAYRHFYVYGAMLIERMALLAGGEELFQVEKFGEEQIREALQEGQGVLLLTSHLGNWEAMAQCLSCIDAPVTLVMYDGVQPQVKRALEDLSARQSFEVLYTDGGPTSAAGILGALGRGSIVGLMADRTLAGRGVELPFLGGEALFPVGPYSIGAAAGCPVLQVFAIRTAPYAYQFRAFDLGRLRYANRRDKQTEFERWASDFAGRLEDFTRRHPEQWGNLYEFWKEPFSA